jgi:hypothetical protein
MIRRELLFAAWVAALTACGEPTAADLARESDRIQRELLSESADPASVWHTFGIDDMIDNLPVMGRLELQVDGRRRRHRAFVFERLVLRPDLAVPECPLVTRTVMAGSGADGIVIHTAEGPSAIRPLGRCEPRHGQPGGIALIDPGGAAAIVITGGRQTMEGRTGAVDLRLLPAVGEECGFLAMRDDANEPLVVTCVVLRYAVRAEATLEPRPSKHSAPGPRRLRVREQELPGIRITIECNTRSESIGGCERDYGGREPADGTEAREPR